MEVKETLEKQLELLSERSKTVDDMCLADVTEQMVQIAALLLDREKSQSFYGASTCHPYVVQLPVEDLVDLYAARAELMGRHSVKIRNAADVVDRQQLAKNVFDRVHHEFSSFCSPKSDPKEQSLHGT